MNRDELCSIGVMFVQDEKYALSRYKMSEKNLFFKAWNETFDKSPLINDEQFQNKSWEDVLLDTNKLQLKIMDKLSQKYVGEVVLMNLDAERPELGIQLMKIECLTVRIRSDNYISQKLFEKMGAIKIGEEGKEYTKLMYELMNTMGKEKFEKTIEASFESTQVYTICYKLPVM